METIKQETKYPLQGRLNHGAWDNFCTYRNRPKGTMVRINSYKLPKSLDLDHGEYHIPAHDLRDGDTVYVPRFDDDVEVAPIRKGYLKGSPQPITEFAVITDEGEPEVEQINVCEERNIDWWVKKFNEIGYEVVTVTETEVVAVLVECDSQVWHRETFSRGESEYANEDTAFLAKWESKFVRLHRDHVVRVKPKSKLVNDRFEYALDERW